MRERFYIIYSEIHFERFASAGRLRDELVVNYHSDGTLERLAVHHGILGTIKVLAGDLIHSWC